MIQITRNAIGAREVTVTRDPSTWRFQLRAHGANEITPDAINTAVANDLAAAVAKTAADAKPVAGKPAMGLQLIPKITEAIKAIAQAQIAKAQTKAKLAQIEDDKAATVADPELDGQALLNKIAVLDAERVRAQAVLDQQQADLARKQHQHQAMLPSFRQDRDATLRGKIDAEILRAKTDLDAAWGAVERSLEKPLAKVAELQARLTALETPGTFTTLQGQIEATLIPPVATDSAVEPELAEVD